MAVQETNGIQNVLALLGAVKGGKQTSTTSNNVSPEGVQELVNSMLRSNQGLAAVASGQKAAGVYNSSTNQLLTNDLLSQVAAKAALAKAGTTTTQRAAPLLSGGNILTIGALLKAPAATKKLWDAWKSTDLGSSLAFGTDTATSEAWASGAGRGMDTLSSMGMGSADSVTSFLSSVGIDSAALSASEVGALQSTLGLSDAGTAASAFSSGTDVGSWSDAGAKISAEANLGGNVSSAGSVATAAKVTAETDMFGGAGTGLGYLSGGLKALEASKTTKDYRQAGYYVGLNYIGAGPAAPIAAPVMETISDEAIRFGDRVGGVSGALVMDPFGTVASGKYSGSDLAAGFFDPLDLFGGTPGGIGKGIVTDTVSSAVDEVGRFVGKIFGW